MALINSNSLLNKILKKSVKTVTRNFLRRIAQGIDVSKKQKLKRSRGEKPMKTLIPVASECLSGHMNDTQFEKGMGLTHDSALQKALFLDRDGVINVEKEYLHKAEDFEFIDGVFEVLRYAQQMGYLLIVITNQSGIGRGYYTDEDFQHLNRWMCDRFSQEGIRIAEVYYCPHAPDSVCDCRKPLPGMIHAAANRFQIDFDHSVLIGDKESDIEAGKSAGVGVCILARSGHRINESASKADAVVDSIKDLKPYLEGTM